MAVDTDTARGLLMLRLSPAMAATVVDMARGLLMPSLRLRPRLSPDMAMVATAVDTAVMAMAVATTARGRLRLSPATAVDTAAMDVDTAMVATARGLLSPAMAMAAMAGATAAMVATDTAGATATGVSYHQIRRSELSQKQKHKNSQR